MLMQDIQKLYPYMLIVWAMFVLTLFPGCKEFLSEVQDNRISVESKETVLELLVNAYPDAFYAEFAESLSDNAGDKGPGGFRDVRDNRNPYFWRDFNSDGDDETPENYWEESYEAIAHANQALLSIEELGNISELNGAKGEALLARAYAHFMLVNFWAMRYDPSTAQTELGIPYVAEVENVAVKSYSRNKISEVYELIEKDLTEGIRLIDDENYSEPKFHFNIDAARAFATRFYLYKGEWDIVINYASDVLGSSPSDKTRDWEDYGSLSYDERSIRYSSSSEPTNLLIVWANSAYGRKFATNRYALSNDKVEELFRSSSNPFNKGWEYDVFGRDFSRNIAKYEEFFKLTNPTQRIGFAFTPVVLFSVDEVLLNRAEAYAMKKDYELAGDDLEAFLSTRVQSFNSATDTFSEERMRNLYPFIEDEYTPFYDLDTSQTAFVKGIAELKRRDFYHEGLRWLDIKRFDLKVVHPVQGRDTVMLPKGDRRRAIQIPEFARVSGIEPNRR